MPLFKRAPAATGEGAPAASDEGAPADTDEGAPATTDEGAPADPVAGLASAPPEQREPPRPDPPPSPATLTRTAQLYEDAAAARQRRSDATAAAEQQRRLASGQRSRRANAARLSTLSAGHREKEERLQRAREELAQREQQQAQRTSGKVVSRCEAREWAEAAQAAEHEKNRLIDAVRVQLDEQRVGGGRRPAKAVSDASVVARVDRWSQNNSAKEQRLQRAREERERREDGEMRATPKISAASRRITREGGDFLQRERKAAAEKAQRQEQREADKIAAGRAATPARPSSAPSSGAFVARQKAESDKRAHRMAALKREEAEKLAKIAPGTPTLPSRSKTMARTRGGAGASPGFLERQADADRQRAQRELLRREQADAETAAAKAASPAINRTSRALAESTMDQAGGADVVARLQMRGDQYRRRAQQREYVSRLENSFAPNIKRGGARSSRASPAAALRQRNGGGKPLAWERLAEPNSQKQPARPASAPMRRGGVSSARVSHSAISAELERMQTQLESYAVTVGRQLADEDGRLESDEGAGSV